MPAHAQARGRPRTDGRELWEPAQAGRAKRSHGEDSQRGLVASKLAVAGIPDSADRSCHRAMVQKCCPAEGHNAEQRKSSPKSFRRHVSHQGGADGTDEWGALSVLRARPAPQGVVSPAYQTRHSLHLSKRLVGGGEII